MCVHFVSQSVSLALPLLLLLCDFSFETCCFCCWQTCGTFPFRIFPTFFATALCFHVIHFIAPLFLLSANTIGCLSVHVCVRVCVCCCCCWWDYERLWLLIHTTCSTPFTIVPCASYTPPLLALPLEWCNAQETSRCAGCEINEAKSV